MKRLLYSALFVLAVSGCATTGDPRMTAASVQLVERALTEPADQLKREADQGLADAQFSYSIVKRYGLDGGKPDAAAADAYRQLALGPRDTTSIPTGGKYGSLLSVPVYAGVTYMAKTADACTAALAAGLKPEAVTTECGGADTYRRLADLWSRKRS